MAKHEQPPIDDLFEIERRNGIMERHLRVIDAILDIGRKIASHSELKKSLKNIAMNAKDLMQFEFCWILLRGAF